MTLVALVRNFLLGGKILTDALPAGGTGRVKLLSSWHELQL